MSNYFDIDSFFKHLRLENGLLIIGGISLMLSLYQKYELGIRLSLTIIIFSALLRFYNLSIIKSFGNMLLEPKTKRKDIEFYDEDGKKKKRSVFYCELKDCWWFYLLDFLLSLILLLIFIYYIQKIVSLRIIW